MRYYIILLLLFVGFNSYSQERKDTSKWSKLEVYNEDVWGDQDHKSSVYRYYSYQNFGTDTEYLVTFFYFRYPGDEYRFGQNDMFISIEGPNADKLFRQRESLIVYIRYPGYDGLKKRISYTRTTENSLGSPNDIRLNPSRTAEFYENNIFATPFMKGPIEVIIPRKGHLTEIKINTGRNIIVTTKKVR